MISRMQLMGLLLTLTMLCAAGCRRAPEGPERLKTTPVSGVVHIDGSPVAGVFVQCIPQQGASIQYPVEARTDADGRFVMGTYETGDGLPVGTYHLTFEHLVSGGLGDPKDSLKGRYKQPQNSSVIVIIEEGKPVVLDQILLTTK